MRKRIVYMMAAVIAGGLIALSPVSPVTPEIAMEAAAQKGKPKPPPPPPATYAMTLGPSIHDDPTSTGNAEDFPDQSQDGLKPAGYLSLPAAMLVGSIAGPNGYENFTGTMSGAITGLTITGVAELPDWFDGGDPCQDNEIAELTSLGLVAAPVDGTLSMTLTELGGSLKGTPHITWSLGNVLDAAGATWTLQGHSGRSRAQFAPVYEPGSTAANLTVTVEGSIVDFVGPTFSVLKCRADYTMTLAKVSR
jgi:hypothetical protein